MTNSVQRHYLGASLSGHSKTLRRNKQPVLAGFTETLAAFLESNSEPDAELLNSFLSHWTHLDVVLVDEYPLIAREAGQGINILREWHQELISV